MLISKVTVFVSTFDKVETCYTVDKAEIVFVFLSFPRIGKRFANVFENFVNDRPTTILTDFIVRYDTRDELRGIDLMHFFLFRVSRTLGNTALTLHFPYSPCQAFVRFKSSGVFIKTFA